MSRERVARRLNRRGLAVFGEYVSETMRDEPPPMDILFDPDFSEPLEVELAVEPLATDSKYDLGMAIVSGVAEDADVPRLLEDSALWPWLSLYHSARTIPTRHGKRFIGKPHRHIITSASSWAAYDHGHRHLVRGAVQCVHYFDEFARVLLADAGSASKAEENVLSRKTGYPLAYMKNAVEAFYDLHYDERTARAGRGANSTGPGGIIHFVRSLAQLDVNYDIVSLSAQRIIDLLPDTFKDRRQLD
jgi:hypothetical protein